jgi:hypothetical protein
MPSTLSCHAPSRDLVKLPLHERNQSVEGGFVALTPLQEQSRGRRGVIGNIVILCPFPLVHPSCGPFPLYEQTVTYGSHAWCRTTDPDGTPDEFPRVC